MSETLSVILPVQNAETQLESKVTALLDVISELTNDFELLIVDNGSVDGTEEVAMELMRAFPQVHIHRQSQKTDQMEAARRGIAKTTGEMVLIHDINAPLSTDAIQQFWEMRNDKELVFSRSETAHTTKMPRIMQKASNGWNGTQMLRREAVDELRGSEQTSAPVDRVTRTDLGTVASNPNSMLRQLADRPVEQH